MLEETCSKLFWWHSGINSVKSSSVVIAVQSKSISTINSDGFGIKSTKLSHTAQLKNIWINGRLCGVFEAIGKLHSIESEQNWLVNLKSGDILIFTGQFCSDSIEGILSFVSKADWRSAFSVASSGWCWNRCKMFVHSICKLKIINQRGCGKAAFWFLFANNHFICFEKKKDYNKIYISNKRYYQVKYVFYINWFYLT